jgi:hypothetical protein
MWRVQLIRCCIIALNDVATSSVIQDKRQIVEVYALQTISRVSYSVRGLRQRD